MDYKIAIIGDSGSGKTSILARCAYKFFKDGKPSTMVDFATYKLGRELINNEHNVRMQLWDIPGKEKYGSMMEIYLHGSFGAIIVCDVTNTVSIENSKKWLKEFRKYYTKYPCYLAVNKMDLLPRDSMDGLHNNSLLKECTKLFSKVVYVSAKDPECVPYNIMDLIPNMYEDIKSCIHINDHIVPSVSNNETSIFDDINNVFQKIVNDIGIFFDEIQKPIENNIPLQLFFLDMIPEQDRTSEDTDMLHNLMIMQWLLEDIELTRSHNPLATEYVYEFCLHKMGVCSILVNELVRRGFKCRINTESITITWN